MVCPAYLEGQQIARRIDGTVEYCARPREIIHPVIVVAGDEQQRCGERTEPGSPCGQHAAAGRGNRHHGTQPLELGHALQSAAAHIGQQQSARHHPRHGTLRVQGRAGSGQYAVTTGGIADQRRSRRIDQTLRRKRTLQGAGHVHDVERPPQQPLHETVRVVDGRIVVPNGGHHIALGGEIFRQPGHGHRIVAPAMRHHDERKAFARRWRIAHGNAGYAERGRGQGRLCRHARRVHDRCGTGLRSRRIPQLHAEIPITEGRRAARRIEGHHVRLCGLAKLQRPHAHRKSPQGRELRRIDAVAAGRISREHWSGNQQDRAERDQASVMLTGQ